MKRERETPSDIFRAIADPVRRQILDTLSHGPRPAGEIAEQFSISRPAVSRHLRVLRSARVVSEVRRGNRRIYMLDPRPLRQLDDWLLSYRTQMRSKLLALKRFLDSSS